MLIRSSFVSLFLAATVGTAANTEPVSPPIRSPDPEPTPLPDPAERPKTVVLHLLPDQGACDVTYKVETETSGAVAIGFDGLSSEAPQTYTARCRLAGEIVVPKGFRLNPTLTLQALVKGELHGVIDNVTGRLKLSLGRATTRDFQWTEFMEGDTGPKPVQLHLSVQLPELLDSCTQDLTWPVSLFVESSVNGKASSRIEALKLDSLSLLPLDCEPTRKLR